jgi:hypothetical protein
MSTSGTYSFTVTRDDIIRDAMLNIGRLGQTETPTAQEVTDCSRKLNMMVKQWMAQYDFAPGLKMWSRFHQDLFLSSSKYQYALGPTGDQWAAGVATSSTQNYQQNQLTAVTASGSPVLTVGSANVAEFTVGDYLVVELDSGDTFTAKVLSIGASTITMTANISSQASTGNYVFNYTTKGQRPLQITTAILRDINNNDTPLDFMTLETYEALPNKTYSGFLTDPTAIYYESQLDNGQLYIDCAGAQDVTKHIHIVGFNPIMDFNNPTDNPEYPAEWYMALCWGLSKQIAPMFNVPFTADMEANYMEAVAMARQANAETTQVYFMPSSASPYQP